MSSSLLGLEPEFGHGRVWRCTLAELGKLVELVPLGERGRVSRRLSVVLADGHAPLPRGRAPVVIQMHEAGWVREPTRSLLEAPFLAYLEETARRSVAAADSIIVPSSASATDLVEGYGAAPETVHVVPHGVSSAFRPVPGKGRAIVAAAARSAPRPFVMFAGALHPRKNVHSLRCAVERLQRDGHPHRLVIAGGPAHDRSDRAALEAEATAPLAGGDRVAYVREPTDEVLASLLSDADAFCLPSLHEGFGLTALEALACGAPTIVSDRGALPEVVGPAALVAPPDPESLYAALTRLLGDGDLSGRLRAAGPQRAAEFTWERTARGWLAELEGAAS